MPTMARNYKPTGKPRGRPKSETGVAVNLTVRVRPETRTALAEAMEARGETADQVIAAALAALAREAIAPDA